MLLCGSVALFFSSFSFFPLCLCLSFYPWCTIKQKELRRCIWCNGEFVESLCRYVLLCLWFANSFWFWFCLGIADRGRPPKGSNIAAHDTYDVLYFSRNEKHERKGEQPRQHRDEGKERFTFFSAGPLLSATMTHVMFSTYSSSSESGVSSKLRDAASRGTS